MFNWDNFKRDEFTREDQEKIEKMVDMGEVGRLCQVIAIDSPVKEYWVNKIVKAFAAPVVADELNFSEEMRAHTAKGEEMTPEIEAQFEAKLKAEREKLKLEAELKAVEEEESLARSVSVHIETEAKKPGRKSKKSQE